MQNDFFAHAPVGCFLLHPDGQIEDVNPVGAALLGGRSDDVRGKPLAAFVAAGDRARLGEYLRRVGASDRPQRIEVQVQRPGGDGFAARLEGSAARGADGALWIHAVLHDGTSEDALRRALAAGEERLNRAIREAPIPVAVHTDRGDILALSRVWTEITGYSAAELPTLDAWIERAYGPAQFAGKKAAIQALQQQLFEQNRRLHEGEFAIRTHAGATRIWDFYSAPLGSLPDGRRLALTMAVDVTERKQAEAELVHARDRAEEMARLKSSFLANMSHEIRTPLTGIIGFAAVLAKELPETYQEFAGLIESSGRRLLDMLNSVLDLAKLESNQLDVDFERLDVQAEGEYALRTLLPLAEQKGLTLTFEVAPGAEHVRSYLDRPALARILTNLVGNAIKFTDQGGVTLRLEADADHVYLHVSDTGIGIDPMFLPYLFDEFRQESTGVSRTHGGSGLGLAITKRLVELMRGRITVQSVKGEGATFSLAFARAPEEVSARPEEAPAPEAAAPPAGVPRRVRLLLVEDQPEAQYLLLELLDHLYDVTIASTAAEALHLARHSTFDLVLMDIRLGEGPDGTDVLRRLRAIPAYRETPIVALTAYALPGDRERFLEMGFTAYMSKPFDVDELLRLPAQLLAS